MTRMNLEDIASHLAELLPLIEKGERITVLKDGKPVFELVPPARELEPRRGPNWEAFEAWKKANGITQIIGELPPDWDDPLPEDFLITPE